jgi:hypothetical protein
MSDDKKGSQNHQLLMLRFCLYQTLENNILQSLKGMSLSFEVE